MRTRLLLAVGLILPNLLISSSLAQNPLLKYVTDDTVALVLAKPRSLIQDTEQQILGDVAYLGQLPIPPSEIEHLALIVRMHPSGEPDVAIAFQFHREFPSATLKRWLAPDAVKVDERDVPCYFTLDDQTPGMFGRPHLALPTRKVALLSFDALLLDQLLQQAASDTPTGTLAKQMKELDESVNFAAMVDVGQIRSFLDNVPSFVRFDAAREVMSLPAELSVLSLESTFGTQRNLLQMRLTERDDLLSSSAVRDWSGRAGATITRLLEIPARSLQRDLPADVDDEINQQLRKVNGFFDDLQPIDTNTDTVFQSQTAPSFSRALSRGTSVLNVAVLAARDVARRMSQRNDFKQVLLAWLNYHDAEKRLPQDITDDAGKPLLSWRVCILPMIGQEALYNEFHLNEAWDSDHNKLLLAEMPAVYQNAWNRENRTHTRLQGVTGTDTALDGTTALNTVTDGTSNTVVLVNAADAVPWTQPADVPFGPAMADRLFFHGETTPVGFLDGAVMATGKLTDAHYRKLFVINDGEGIDFADLDNQPPSIDDALEATYHLRSADVPAVLADFQSDDRKVVREAALKLLTSREDFLSSNRHRMFQITVGWHNHYSAHGQFPLNIASKDGKAGLSWRVRILPFIEQQELYKEFRLSEPWDSDHNKKLIDKMPTAFRDHENQLPAGSTRIQVVKGKGTVFGDRVKMNGIVDGLSVTAALVEAKDAAIWTKPDDLRLQDDIAAQLHTTRSERNVIGLLDGSVLGFAPLTDDVYRHLFFYGDAAPAELPNATEVILASPIDDKITAAAQQRLQAKDPYIRAWAARVYCMYSDTLDWNQMESLLKDPDREVRRYVISQLAFSESQEAAKLLFQIGGGDAAIIDGLLQNPLRNVAADAVAPFLTSDDAEVRSRAVMIVGATGNPGHLPAISPLLQDPPNHDAAEAAIADIKTRFQVNDVATESAANPEQLAQRDQLWTTGQTLLKEEKFDEAFAALRKMLDLERQMFGDTHKEVLDSLQFLANSYAGQGEQTEATEMLKLRTELLEKKFGADHLDTRNAVVDYLSFKELAELDEERQKELTAAEQLQHQAVQQVEAKQFEMALASLAQSIDIKRKLFGNDSVRLLAPLRYQRQQLFAAKRIVEARDAAAEVVRLVSRLIGPDAPASQSDRSELAYLTWFAGDQDQAIKQLLALQKIPVDASNFELMARDARFVGYQLMNREKPDDAGELFEKALQLNDQINKQEDAGEVCMQLAVNSDDDKSAAYAWRSDSFWRYQKSNPYRGFWNNYPVLADSMREAGKYHLEMMLRKALVDALKQGVDAKQVNLLLYAKALTSLAGTYITLGDFILADETLGQCERIVGEFRDDPFVIDLLAHRATVLVHLGDAAAAEKLLDEAARISQNEDPAYRAMAPAALRRLGEFYAGQGKHDRALSLLAKAIEFEPNQSSAESLRTMCAISAAQHGAEKPDEAIASAQTGADALDTASLSAAERIELSLDYSRLWLTLDDAEKAEPLALLAQAICQTNIGVETLSYSEVLSLLARIQLQQERVEEARQTALTALQTTRQIVEHSAYLLSPRQQLAFSETMRASLDLFLSIASTDPDAAADCFTEIFRWKGSGMVRQREIHQLAKREGVAPFYQQLSAITRQLSTVARQPEIDPNEEEGAAAVRELEARANGLSQLKDFLESQLSSSRLAYMDVGKEAMVDDLVAVLPEDGVFVDYFVFDRQPVHNDDQPGRFLLASVIASDGTITIHNLGEMSTIEALIDTWRESFGARAEGKKAGDSLRSRLWDPLGERLVKAQTIVISPDDALGQLPIHALPTKEGDRYLIENHRLAIVAVPQLVPELLRRPSQEAAGQLLLVGDIAYNAEVVERPDANAEASAASLATLGRAIRQGAKFTELPGTRDEIAALGALFRTTIDASPKKTVLTLDKTEASESAFREASSRYVNIHIATHGFFAPPDASGAAMSMQDFNPGLLSGLVFAGANLPHDMDSDDGVLTADEISTMDLEHVELAVLSACETGLGRVAGGEGLIGIQRSFQVSGVGATVASLWQVPDQATRVLMERFYRNLWEQKMSRLDALREAQIFLLNNPEAITNPELARGVTREPSATQKPNDKRLPPQSWAAFVLAGDWR